MFASCNPAPLDAYVQDAPLREKSLCGRIRERTATLPSVINADDGKLRIMITAGPIDANALFTGTCCFSYFTAYGVYSPPAPALVFAMPIYFSVPLVPAFICFFSFPRAFLISVILSFYLSISLPLSFALSAVLPVSLPPDSLSSSSHEVTRRSSTLKLSRISVYLLRISAIPFSRGNEQKPCDLEN